MKEPLIKDEKIRKAVRAWAKIEDVQFANIKKYTHDRFGVCIQDLYIVISDVRNYSVHIVFTSDKLQIKLNTRVDKERDYSIKELCGEEEEK